MDIIELKDISTSSQEADLLLLMRELDDQIPVTAAMLRECLCAPGTHMFALLDGQRIVGCASLCEYTSPTGRKACVEDVVVLSTYRGRHLGRMLLEHVVDYAREHLAPVDLHLTSRPSREAANALYRSLGFERRDTNPYRLLLP